MSIAEAALYGDLVRHLRDLCAQQLAQLQGSSVESQRAALETRFGPGSSPRRTTSTA